MVRSRGCSACCARRVYWNVNYFGVIRVIAMARSRAQTLLTHSARKGLVKRVALPCPHAANRAGPIRLQKHSHMTILARFELCTLLDYLLRARSQALFDAREHGETGRS